jgi:choline dehydrogenase-like flavoprotein
VYLYGAKDDYERWAEVVGDREWGWDGVEGSFHEIETYEFGTGHSGLADASLAKHGKSGLLKVGVPPVLEKGVEKQLQGLVDGGEKICLDPNDGDPIGVSVMPYSYSKEGRSTSASAFLADVRENLEIWTGAKVEGLVWEGERVVGVVTEDGRRGMYPEFDRVDMPTNNYTASASKEVILCAGAFDTPKLLLLNGIGPKDELEALGIEVKKDIPGIGKNLSDHIMAFMSVEVDGSLNDRHTFESNPELVSEAEDLWAKDQTGAFALQHSVLWGGFLKHPNLSSIPEFTHLPTPEREFLSRPTIPTYEFLCNGPCWPPGATLAEGNTYLTLVAFLMHPQSHGSVTLASKNASDKPVIQLNYLTHPYDRAVFRETIRTVWTKITANPAVAPHIRGTLCGPTSLSDEDVDAFARENTSTVWHANGTVKMGKEGEQGACVDKDGKVFGVQGLRVADLSVAPLTTSNHTQATAYLVGRKIGEKVVREYALDG